MTAVVLALAVASCGGSDSLTKAEFVKEARATCKAAERDSKGLVGVKNKSREDMIDFAKSLVADHRKLVDRLDAIEPPDEVATTYARYLTALRQQDELLGKVLAAPEDLNDDGTVKPDTPAAAISQQHDAAAHKAFLLAKQLDIVACGG
ncbi:MAG: hypothetical protein WBC33_05360 [Conexibacter sp.]